jgi:WD40 repeat protein
MQEIYCFNPSCLQINRDDRPPFCQNCGSSLWLHDRYRAVHIVQKNNRSQVFRVLDRLAPNNYILKQVKKEQDYDNYLNRLVAYLKKIDCHPYIPNYIDSFETEKYYYLLQELIEGNNLEISIDRDGIFEVDRVWQVLLDILPSLHHLHSYNLIHRDIKPQNIIYSDELQKFILVDWSNLISIDSSNSIFTGSAEYAAPEIFQGKFYFASDLYSLGLVCLYLLTGLHPFDLFDTVSNNWVWRDYWQIGTTDINRDREARLGEIIDKLIISDLDLRLRSTAEVLRIMGCNITDLEETIVRTNKQQNSPNFIWQLQRFIIVDEDLFAVLNCADFSEDGRFLASGGEDKKITIWEVETGRKIIDLHGHQSKIADVKFVPKTNILISGDSKGKIRFWQWNIDRNIDNKTICEVNTGSGISSIALHPNLPLIASGHVDKKIKIWDRQTQELIKTLSGHILAITDLHFSPVSSLLATASQDRMVKIWDVDTWELRHTLKGHNWVVKTVSFNDDVSILASAGDGKDIKIWDLRSNQLLRNLSGHSWTISRLAFLPDSKNLLLSASWDKKIKLWNVETGEELVVLEGHSDSIFGLAISRAIHCDRSFYIASTSKDKTIGIWNLKIIDRLDAIDNC